MKILVLGGNGYIGSHLIPYLKQNGLNVSVFGKRNDDYNNLSKDFIKNYEYIVVLAGHSSVKMCEGDLKSSWNNNVRNFSSLIDKTTKNQKIIYASSSSVYGNNGGKIFTEEDFSLDFVNNYDLTKISLDLVANKYMTEHNRKIIGLRFGTVNGSSSIIRRDLMINSMVYSSLKTGKILVNNKHIDRPILSIKDLSRSIYTIINNNFISGVYNISSLNSNVDAISKAVQLKTGADIIDNGDYCGVYNFSTDTTKFINFYNFKFEETVMSIVDDVIDCYKNKNPTIVCRDEYFKYNG